GECEQAIRHRETERLGSLHVDDQLVLGRRLHRQVRGFLALEGAIDIAGPAPELVNGISPIGDQTAGDGDNADGENRWQAVSSGTCDNEIAMKYRCRAPGHDQAAVRTLREDCDGALDLAGIAHIPRSYS